MERSKAMSRDEGKGGASAAPYAEGEERYRSVPPKDDLSNYEPLSADTKENIMRCLTCEIPVEYCKGGGCVIAYRTWRADVNSCQKRRKNARGHNERPE